MHSVIFVPDPTTWRRAGTPGGLSLLERQVKQLRRLGIRPPLLLVPAGQPAPALDGALPIAGLVRVPADTDGAAGALVAAADTLPAAFVFLAADRLVDDRVVQAMEAAAADSLIACDGEGRVAPIGHATAAAVRRHGAELAQRADRLPLAALPRYVPALRGEAEPYILTSRTPAERRRAWRVLLDHVQKRSLDLPGRYFDAPFENALVRVLAPTRVTPNQVTLATLVVAVVVGVLFWSGWLRTGIILALVVGVLDGVDGKLARLKLAWSRLGELEHVGDFLYENGWYLALGSYLGTVAPSCWYAALLLVACDVTDNLLYLAAERRTGRMLDEISPFDRAVRQVAGRRNVYVMIFAVGFFAGAAPAALLTAAAWACATVLVHGARVLSLVWRPELGAGGAGAARRGGH